MEKVAVAMIVQRDQVCRNYTGAEKVTVDKWEEMGGSIAE
jgi:hypothetical protein